jgi:D-alanine-D-alanine ligase
MDKRAVLLERGYRVAILCGGTGTEREVSLVSGNAVKAAADSLGLPCDLFDLKADKLPDALDSATHLVLPLIHGAFGEDGRLSSALDAGGFAYAGCDMASSALCFDKFACKAVAARLGIPVAKDQLLPAGQVVSYSDVSAELGARMILKPRRDGSSVGLHLVNDENAFNESAGDMACTDYLAEAFLDGYDLTVGILGETAMGVVSVHPDGGLYDYRHKYTAGLTRYEVPAKIPDSRAAQLRDWSVKLFKACGCRDLARVDFRLGPEGELIFLEINTLPGMTSTSLLPKSASCTGMDFSHLVLVWIGFALDRMEEGKPV